MDPKVVKMTMVKIKDVNDFESFQLNEWKIPEPPIESVPFRENGKKWDCKVVVYTFSFGCKAKDTITSCNAWSCI